MSADLPTGCATATASAADDHCTGKATPSSWTNTTPSTPGSATGVRSTRRQSSQAVKESSVPALRSQAAAVPIPGLSTTPRTPTETWR